VYGIIKTIILRWEIEEAKKKFGKNNGIRLNKYVSKSENNKNDCNIDAYIGKDVFTKNIKKWLSFFEGDEYVFLKLLKKYKYYTENEIKAYMEKFFDKVCENFPTEVADKDIFFLTFPSKNGVKSGGDDLRTFMLLTIKSRYVKDRIVADYQKCKNEIIENAKIIFFIDDVVGTGQTLYRNIKNFFDEIEMHEREKYRVYLAVIYGRAKKIEEKIKDLEKLGICAELFYIDKDIKKCFAGNYIFKEKEVNKYITTVKKYEELIENNRVPEDSEPVCIMGYKENQYLVSMCYNTPNNTLSTFWRPSKDSFPLFMRTSYTNVRPTIKNMSNRKERQINKAYNYRKQINER